MTSSDELDSIFQGVAYQGPLTEVPATGQKILTEPGGLLGMGDAVGWEALTRGQPLYLTSHPAAPMQAHPQSSTPPPAPDRVDRDTPQMCRKAKAWKSSRSLCSETAGQPPEAGLGQLGSYLPTPVVALSNAPYILVKGQEESFWPSFWPRQWCPSDIVLVVSVAISRFTSV